MPTLVWLLTALVVLVASSAQAQTIKLGEVLTFFAPDLKPDADLAAFERQVTGQLVPAWTKNAPGVSLHLVKKDRGPRPGQYLLVWVTDTLARHKSYAAASGDVPFRLAVTSNAGDPRTVLAAFLKGPGAYSEFHLVHPEKVGAALPTVDVLGNHYIKVRPDRVAAFDTFIGEKLHPTVGNLRPDLRLLYYKPVRGEQPGHYITVIALTMASRDKYWPKGADSDVLKATFTPPVRALATELETYLVPGTWGVGMTAAVYEAKEWGDWAIK